MHRRGNRRRDDQPQTRARSERRGAEYQPEPSRERTGNSPSGGPENLAEAASSVSDVRNELRVQPHESGTPSGSPPSATSSASLARAPERQRGAESPQRR